MTDRSSEAAVRVLPTAGLCALESLLAYLNQPRRVRQSRVLGD